jgi:hypothetical protein
VKHGSPASMRISRLRRSPSFHSASKLKRVTFSRHLAGSVSGALLGNRPTASPRSRCSWLFLLYTQQLSDGLIPPGRRQACGSGGSTVLVAGQGVEGLRGPPHGPPGWWLSGERLPEAGGVPCPGRHHRHRVLRRNSGPTRRHACDIRAGCGSQSLALPASRLVRSPSVVSTARWNRGDGGSPR